MTLCTDQGKTTAHVIFVNSMTNFLMPTTQKMEYEGSPFTAPMYTEQ